MSLTDIANIAKELLPPVRGFIRWLWGGLQWLYRHLLRSKRAKFYGLRDDIRSVRVRTGTLLTGEPSPLSDHGDPEDLGYEVDAGVLVRNLQSVMMQAHSGVLRLSPIEGTRGAGSASFGWPCRKGGRG